MNHLYEYYHFYTKSDRQEIKDRVIDILEDAELDFNIHTFTHYFITITLRPTTKENINFINSLGYPLLPGRKCAEYNKHLLDNSVISRICKLTPLKLDCVEKTTDRIAGDRLMDIEVSIQFNLPKLDVPQLTESNSMDTSICQDISDILENEELDFKIAIIKDIGNDIIRIQFRLTSKENVDFINTLKSERSGSMFVKNPYYTKYGPLISRICKLTDTEYLSYNDSVYRSYYSHWEEMLVLRFKILKN